MNSDNVTYLTRADHDPGADWPEFYRQEKIAAFAPERHASRVAATITAARQAAEQARPGQYPREQEAFYASHVARLAEVLILLDLGGVGGLRGYGGGASRRMPWASHLGSARWQAGDGAAWRAAAEDALVELGPVEAIRPAEAEDLFWLELFETCHEWTVAYAARACLRSTSPEVAHAWDKVRERCERWRRMEEDEEAAQRDVAIVRSGIARGLSPVEAREGLDLSPLAVSLLLPLIGPEFLCEGDRLDPEESVPEEVIALPESARAILFPYGSPPEVSIPSKGGGPTVEIVRRRSE